MYEMVVGYPPFYSDEPMNTCRKVNVQCRAGLFSHSFYINNDKVVSSCVGRCIWLS
jgi:hypothetical protein